MQLLAPWVLGMAGAALPMPDPDPDPGPDPEQGPPPLIDEGLVLTRGAPGSLHEYNLGSPTLAHDPDAAEYVMYFEYRGAWGTPARCASGAGTEWGIGRATSPDGLDWTVDPDAALHPSAGSFWECAAVHPHVLRDEDGTWHLWFKGWQEAGKTCDDDEGNADGSPDPEWGCETVTGIGYASSPDGVTWTAHPTPVVTFEADPTPEDFGWPRVVQVSGTWLMLFNYGDNGFTLATAPAPEGPWTWEGMQGTALTPGSEPWTEGELIVADLTCHDDPEPQMLTLWFGTNLRDPAAFWSPPIGRTLGVAEGLDVEDWLLETEPRASWSEADVAEDRAWRAWSTLSFDDGGTMLVYQRFSDGGNDIGMAYTEGTSWDPDAIRPNVCDYPGLAPLSEPDSFEVAADQSLVLLAPGVLDNDLDRERNPIHAELVQDVAHGTLTLAPNGAITYVPDRTFVGTDTFTYAAHDGTTAGDPVAVTLSVTAPTGAPLLRADTYEVNQGMTLDVAAENGVLSNDLVDLPVQVSAEPANGTLLLEPDGSLSYTPDPSFHGQDRFSYIALDGLVVAGEAEVTIDVAQERPRRSRWQRFLDWLRNWLEARLGR